MRGSFHAKSFLSSHWLPLLYTQTISWVEFFLWDEEKMRMRLFGFLPSSSWGAGVGLQVNFREKSQKIPVSSPPPPPPPLSIISLLLLIHIQSIATQVHIIAFFLFILHSHSRQEDSLHLHFFQLTSELVSILLFIILVRHPQVEKS